MTTASVIIPAFNEQQTIGATIRSLSPLAVVDEVWVIDDGSDDETASEARRAGAKVVRLGRNRGKGRALMEGFQRANGDAVALLDADLGKSASEVRQLLNPVLAGEADLAIARFRPAHSSQGFGIVKQLAGWGLRRACGHSFASPLCGQRVLHRRVIPAIVPLAAGWGVEVGMTVDAVQAGFRVQEIAVEMGHRATGRDWVGFLHRARQLRDIVAALRGHRLPVDELGRRRHHDDGQDHDDGRDRRGDHDDR